MNAKKNRVNLNLSPIEFPDIIGMAMQSALTLTVQPNLVNNKLVLRITKTFLFTETYTNKEHEIFKAQSVYDIKNIKTKKDLCEFYKDGELNLS
jgi:hypothetical protein